MNGSTARRPGRFNGRYCSGILLCLVAAFAQIVLPIAHRYFLDVTEAVGKTRCSVEDFLRAGNPAVAAQAGSIRGLSGHSPHDPDTCAVCQAILHASNFLGATMAGPVCAPLSTDLYDLDGSQGIPVRHESTENLPRAPPLRSRPSILQGGLNRPITSPCFNSILEAGV